MLIKNEFPIMEFDTSKTSKIDPKFCVKARLTSNKLVITFFPDVIEKYILENKINLVHTINGENPVKIYAFCDDPSILITLGQVGCPACSGNLDYFWGMGINKVMFCGGGGVLDTNIAVGQLLVVDGAIRDEGFSYHYIEASRIINSNKRVADKIVSYLEAHNIPYLRGLTWTTDAMFRETQERIELRKSEGAKIVEMEQSGNIAVSQFRDFDYGAIIYGGDDVSKNEWDSRGWNSREGIRYNLVQLCKEIVNEF